MQVVVGRRYKSKAGAERDCDRRTCCGSWSVSGVVCRAASSLPQPLLACISMNVSRSAICDHAEEDRMYVKSYVCSRIAAHWFYF